MLYVYMSASSTTATTVLTDAWHRLCTDILSINHLLMWLSLSYNIYGTLEQPTTNHATLRLFSKAKKDLEMSPPIRDTLELHAIHANYQAKICFQANKEHIDVLSLVATMARKDTVSLTTVWMMAALNWWHVAVSQSARLADVLASRRTCSALQHVDVM